MSDEAPGRDPARELSSRATALYKFGFPLGMAAWTAGGALFALGAGSRADPDARSVAVLFALLGGGLAAFLGWLLGRVKRVRLVGDTLEVSNFRRRILVPLGDVERVSGTRFSNPERIFLELRTPSAFGSRIAFIPPLRWLRGFSAHPLVAELAARADACRGPVPPAPIAPPRSGLGRVVSSAALLLLALAAFVVVGEYVMRSSPAYRSALAQARASRQLAAAIGEPMREGWLVDGSIRSGTARLEFDLIGPRGEAHVHAESRKTGGVWSTQALSARLPGRPERIDLTTASGAGEAKSLR